LAGLTGLEESLTTSFNRPINLTLQSLNGLTALRSSVVFNISITFEKQTLGIWTTFVCPPGVRQNCAFSLPVERLQSLENYPQQTNAPSAVAAALIGQNERTYYEIPYIIPIPTSQGFLAS